MTRTGDTGRGTKLSSSPPEVEEGRETNLSSSPTEVEEGRETNLSSSPLKVEVGREGVKTDGKETEPSFDIRRFDDGRGKGRDDDSNMGSEVFMVVGREEREGQGEVG